MNTITRIFSQRKTLGLLAVAFAILRSDYVSGAQLDSQWRNLPEVQTKPESGASGKVATVAGGNMWKDVAQRPDSVPISFSLYAAGALKDGVDTGRVYTAISGQTVGLEFLNDWDEIIWKQSNPAVVNLKPNQIYTLTIWGDTVYGAQALLTPPSLNKIFSSATVAKQPARLYNIYYFNPDHQKWEKTCPSNEPGSSLADDWQENFSVSYQIQVRPDLGARPVTKPGAKTIGPEDQGDDAWTRDEPAIDAQTAPGDGDPVTIGSSKQGDPTSVRLNWAVSMGRLWSGAGAGKISIDEWRLDTNAFAPAILNYAPRSDDTNELLVLMDPDNTNCLSQINAPQALVSIDRIFGSGLLVTNDLLSVTSLVHKLTLTNADLVSQYIFTNFTTNAQQILLNTNSTFTQLQTNLLAELNRLMQGSSIFDSNRFASVAFSSRTWRLLLSIPTGSNLVRLNRFLMEDAYASDLAKLQSAKFNLNFYISAYVGAKDALGFFTLMPGATPFVTWCIGLPDGVATNQWQLQEIRNGSTNASLLTFTPANNLWTLTRGTGNDARIETRLITTNSISGTNFSVETQEVKNGAGILSDRTTEVYQKFDWGYELVAATNDPGGANLATLFTFNSDTNDLASGGKISSIIYPDGFWERRIYSPYDDPDDFFHYTDWPFGNLMRIVQPWKDTPITADDNDCLVTDYQFDIFGLPGNYMLQKWHDATAVGESAEVGTQLWDRQYSAAYQEETYSIQDPCAESAGIVEETRQLGNIEHYGEYHFTKTFSPYYGRLTGQLYSKEDNVGKRDSYDYEFGSWDDSSLIFTPSDTNTNDVRQIILHGGGVIGDEITYGPSGAAIEPVMMPTNRALKEVRVIHGGNLVAKEMYVYQGDLTNFALITQVIYQRDVLGHATNVLVIDPSTHQSRVIYKADWKGANTWPADIKLSETDEFGTVYSYTYDSLKRTKTKVKQGATGQSAITNTMVYDAAGRTLTNTVSASNLSQISKTHFDLAGRKTDETGPDGLMTTYSYSNGGRQTTIAASSGVTTIINKFLDRRIANISGTGVTNQFFDYKLTTESVFPAEVPKNLTFVTLGSSNSLRWTADASDPRYEHIADVKPAFATSYARPSGTYTDITNLWCREFLWDAETWAGFLEPALDAGPYRLETMWRHDPFLERTAEARPGQEDGFTDFSPSLSRITTWTNYYQQDSPGIWFYVTESWAYPNYNDNTTKELIGRTRERLTGFASTGVSETQTFDADTNQTTTKVTIDLANKKLIATTNVASSSLTATQVVVNGLVQSESSTTVAQPSLHFYDSLGRETGLQDPLGNLYGTGYDQTTGQVISRTDPHAGVTTFQYYPAGGTNAGLLKCQTGPTGRKIYYNYDGCGRMIQKWGDVPYPESRDYNQFGDLTALTTYRGGSGWSGSSWPVSTGTGDTTHWYYDEPTGLLTNKTDAAGQSVKFDYYPNWYSKSHIWARGISSTNIYDFDGTGSHRRRNNDLIRIDYSDGSSVLFTNQDYPYLNRRDRADVMIDASGTNYLTYDHAQRIISTYCSGGLLAGITVTNHFNSVYGRDALGVVGPSWALTNTYGYDSYGRLGDVHNGLYSASYSYLANSDLLQTTTCKSNTTTILTTRRSWETGPRLSAILNEVDGSIVTSHGYTYDLLNRRTRASLEDGSVWAYDYNDRDELTGARRYWADWSPVSGQHFAYAFDNIGNRLSVSSGGDTNGGNLRTATYTANNLNEYTSVSTPGYKDIIGLAFATNLVTVNSGTADRKCEYFHREISIANSGGPLWQGFTVDSGGTTNAGGCAFPANSRTLTYDADGNPTFDGVWVYQWDGENRLTTMVMTNISGIANSNRLKLEFTYDCQSRRVQKVISTWNGSTFASPVTNRFVYDGWNLVAELQSSAFIRSYTWGQDISGLAEQAGGVGGLLLVTFVGSSTTNCFAGYDGNGNLTALISATDKSTLARYEYNPFGEAIRVTGLLAQSNPFRFSTKFNDQESTLIYFGYRYYDPSIGRWLGRDPSGEPSGNNLYAFLRNRSPDSIDTDGRSSKIWATITAVVVSVNLYIRAQFEGSYEQVTEELEAVKGEIETLGGRGPKPPPKPNTPAPPPPRPPRQINPNSTSRWVENRVRGRSGGYRGGGGAGLAIGGIFLGGAIGMANAAPQLAQTFSDYAKHLENGDQAWADLDAITFGAQMSAGGADYFFTMGVVDILMAVGDAAAGGG